MVYLLNFERFIEATEKMYLASPTKTRYCLKYRHKDGKLVLKVTDDATCLKFRSEQQNDLKRFAVAKDAIKAAYPEAKITGRTDGSGNCGGDYMVAVVRDGAETPVWKGPQSNLSEWSGQKDATLKEILEGLKKLA
eukprot:m51a1_g1688 putative signal recognition particle 9 kda (136) ;mRNA; f:456880-457879